MISPYAVVFRPIFKPKPWGGRELARLFGKPLPEGMPIGESWELSDLPGDESCVRGGPLDGRPISELRDTWGAELLGASTLIDGRFPLLIKFLDARETLSVQVHPKPPADAPHAADNLRPPASGVKNECWFVIAAEPNAHLFIGLNERVTVGDVRRAAGTRQVAELLRRWPAKPGRCYYLPSGIPHALGAGVVVAEIQTPSDVTYRLYDWERVGLDGRPRALHVEQALANLVDAPPEVIVPRRSHIAGAFQTVTRLVACESFLIARVRVSAGLDQPLPHGAMLVWVVLRGRGEFRSQDVSTPFTAGEVVLVPARQEAIRLRTDEDCDVLEITLPVASRLPGRSGPRGEPRLPPTAPVALRPPGRRPNPP